MINKYNIALLDRIEQLPDISTSWNELLTLSRSNTLCLTFEWLSTWAKCFLASDRKLFTLAIYEKDKLIGIAPWCMRFINRILPPLKQIEFLGSPEMGSDYLDVFIKKGKEKEITHCIYQYLFGGGSHLWDTLLLRDIPSDSLFLNYFIEKIRNDGKYISIREGAFCPIVVLPESWEEYFKNVSRNRREQFRRHYRLLQRHGDVKYEKIIQGVDAPWNLERFISLYKRWWGKNQDERFYTHLREFSTRCDSGSWLQMDFLTVNGIDVAALLHSRYQGELLMHLMAVNKDFNKKISVGNILVGICLEEAILEGIKRYDFLKGNEDYKFHWANSGRRSLEISLYQRRLKVFGRLLSTMSRDIARIFLR